LPEINKILATQYHGSEISKIEGEKKSIRQNCITLVSSTSFFYFAMEELTVIQIH